MELAINQVLGDQVRAGALPRGCPVTPARPARAISSSTVPCAIKAAPEGELGVDAAVTVGAARGRVHLPDQVRQQRVDRPALAEQVLEGAAVPASEVFGPGAPWGSTERPPSADPEAARRLLAEAGYGPDRPLSLQLWTYPARQELPILATAVQQMLAAAGIDTTIRVAEYSTLEPDVLAGAHDLFVLSRSYLTDIPDAAGFLGSDYSCAGAYNLNRYCSAEFDQILTELGSVSDPAQRQELFRVAADQLTTDVAGIPLAHSRSTVALRGVTGFVPDPLEKTLLTPQLGRAAGG